MSLRAWIYILGILMTSCLVSWIAYKTFQWDASYQSTFVILLIAATVAQLCRVEGPNQILHYATPIFNFAALLLLPPFLFIIIIIIPLLIEWIKERSVNGRYLRYWYIQPFNMSMSIIAGFVAHWSMLLFASDITLPGLFSFSGIIAAAMLYIVVRETMLGLALALARNVSIRKSGVFTLSSLFTELVLVLQGYVIAMLWYVNPLVILAALTPLGIMYRALKIPQLEQEAQTDPKTGLMNTRYFNTRFAEELGRAQRFNRPLSFIMADLDLLRNINNTYGHLAGDAVLVKIGQIIHYAIREYDVAARFGGEEFAIILPEADVTQAYTIAERIRYVVETTEFIIPTQEQPIQATMSLGVACFPHDATTATDLQHHADLAVYRAKSMGRNRVVVGSEPTAEQRPIAHESTAFQQLPTASPERTDHRSKNPNDREIGGPHVSHFSI